MQKKIFNLIVPILLLFISFSCSVDGDSVDVYQAPSDSAYISNSGALSTNAVLRINKDVFDNINADRLKNINEGDIYIINKVTRVEDNIQINLSYSGGCKQHEFQIIWDGIVYTDDPCHMNLLLIHNGNNDECETLITETINVNLNELIGDVSYKDSCDYYIFSSFNSTNTADAVIN